MDCSRNSILLAHSSQFSRWTPIHILNLQSIISLMICLELRPKRGLSEIMRYPSSRVVLGCSFSLPIFPSPVLQDCKGCRLMQSPAESSTWAILCTESRRGQSGCLSMRCSNKSMLNNETTNWPPNRCWKHQFRWSLARDKWGQMEYNSKILPPHQWDVSGRQLGDKWEKSAKPCGPQHPQHAGRQGGETSAKPCSPQHPQHAGRQGGETSAKPCSPQHPQHAAGDKGERQVQSHAAHSTHSMLGDKWGETSAKPCSPQHPQHAWETRGRDKCKAMQPHSTPAACWETRGRDKCKAMRPKAPTAY